ncbi:MAG: hypothetical protein PVG30_09490 [Gammaproteobacteria bacterium]|jgi:hypothetical protein
MHQFLITNLWSFLNSIFLVLLIPAFFIWMKILLSARYDKKTREHTVIFEKTFSTREKIFKEISGWIAEIFMMVLDLDFCSSNNDFYSNSKSLMDNFRKFITINEAHIPKYLLCKLYDFEFASRTYFTCNFRIDFKGLLRESLSEQETQDWINSMKSLNDGDKIFQIR